MAKCKVIENCRQCQCSQTPSVGLADKLAHYRPPDRIIERNIVELATRCEMCDCQTREAGNAREEP